MGGAPGGEGAEGAQDAVEGRAGHTGGGEPVDELHVVHEAQLTDRYGGERGEDVTVEVAAMRSEGAGSGGVAFGCDPRGGELAQGQLVAGQRTGDAEGEPLRDHRRALHRGGLVGVAFGASYADADHTRVPVADPPTALRAGHPHRRPFSCRGHQTRSTIRRPAVRSELRGG